MAKKDKITSLPIEKVPIAEVKISGQDDDGRVSSNSEEISKQKEDKFKKTIRVDK